MPVYWNKKQKNYLHIALTDSKICCRKMKIKNKTERPSKRAKKNTVNLCTESMNYVKITTVETKTFIEKIEDWRL